MRKMSAYGRRKERERNPFWSWTLGPSCEGEDIGGLSSDHLVVRAIKIEEQELRFRPSKQLHPKVVVRSQPSCGRFFS